MYRTPHIFVLFCMVLANRWLPIRCGWFDELCSVHIEEFNPTNKQHLEIIHKTNATEEDNKNWFRDCDDKQQFVRGSKLVPRIIKIDHDFTLKTVIGSLNGCYTAIGFGELWLDSQPVIRMNFAVNCRERTTYKLICPGVKGGVNALTLNCRMPTVIGKPGNFHGNVTITNPAFGVNICTSFSFYVSF